MPVDNALVTSAARLAYLPFRLLGRRATVAPRRALILQPGDGLRVLLTTPLLMALAEAFPTARFDWAVAGEERRLVATNPHVAELVDSGNVGLPQGSWSDVADVAAALAEMGYDTCLVPNESSLLAWLPWRAGIPQRIGLAAGGRGFAHTTAVRATDPHWSAQALALARALGVPSTPPPAFFPTDRQRAAMIQQVAEWGWTRRQPLVLIYADAAGPAAWPAERYALAVNRIDRAHQPFFVLLGPLAAAAGGLAAVSVVRPVEPLSWGELGALAELAGLLVSGADLIGQIGAAVGCPVVLIGDGDARSRPLAGGAPLRVVGRDESGQVSVDALETAVAGVLPLAGHAPPA